MLDYSAYYNIFEVALWSGIGLELLRRALQCEERTRLRLVCAAAIFMLFAASDAVELSTGAWWRPWWLLVWKATCLAVLFLLLLDYVVQRRKGDHSN